MKKKDIHEQTMVITGASSGIGLATAYRAAEKGAQLVLASRNEEDLKEICKNIERKGGTATYVKADVTQEEEVHKIADHAMETFGGFDTWVNNAGVGIFGKLMEIPIEDERQLFETNLWGVVYGSRIALSHLKEKGGTIINMGSMVSNRSLPLLGTYSASKHAVKAFSDALRMEIEKEGFPVEVTTMKPGAINTPFVKHARNWMDEEAKLPPPYYDPEVVAKAILQCSKTSHRDVSVANMAASGIIAMEHLVPRTLDHVMEWTMFDFQKKKNGSKRREDGLYEAPPKEGEIRGDYEGPVLRRNLNTEVRLDPKKLWPALSVGLSALLWWGLSDGKAEKTVKEVAG